MKLKIRPHKDAPLFADDKSGKKQLRRLIRKITLDDYTPDEEFLELIRQAGLVNLWFFGKFIAAYSAEFGDLNENLHIDMCNYRQDLLDKGVRGAMFIPRLHFKSAICTELGGAWELIRNPNLKICIVNAVAEKAQEFMISIKLLFERNAFIAQLYPDCVPKSNQPRWNNKEIVMANRTKIFREPSVYCIGVGGSSEGYHFDLIICDDLIGMSALNSTHQSGAEMMRTSNWFWTAEKTLVMSALTSRVIVIGTRYAIDDVYDTIIKRSYEVVGYPMDNYKPNPKGNWKVYYRKAIENSVSIFPERCPLSMYEQLAEDDWWTYVTQFLNDPQQSGLAEFNTYEIKKCTMDYDNTCDMWFIKYFHNGEYIDIPLLNCDVLIAIDPAATEKYISAKTSRTAVGVLATHSSGLKFFISVHADYVTPLRMFDWIFGDADKFERFLRGAFLEANAGFKVLGPIIKEEMRRRKKYFHLDSSPAFGDKDARIRSNLQPELEEGRIFVHEAYYDLVYEELRSFPQSQKKDILDMMSTAVSVSICPPTQEEMIREKLADDDFNNRLVGAAGY